LVVNYVIAGN